MTLSKQLNVYDAKNSKYNSPMMKLLLTLTLLIPISYAGQGELLSIARDSYLKSALKEMKAYCDIHRPDLSPDEKHFYICSLQVKADCSHGEDGVKAEACALRDRIESLEKMILASDRNLALVERVPVGKSLGTPFKINVRLNY